MVEVISTDIPVNIAAGIIWYATLVALIRLAGKRLAGQTATVDFMVLVTLSVVLQQALVGDGRIAAFSFVFTVFLAHKVLSFATRRFIWVRKLIRSAPRPLVLNGQIDHRALREEGLRTDELHAGLRRLGFRRARDVRLAVLEETGHLSAVPFQSTEKQS
jgi:uncharacterized membrane protein YcaP (DUF421 family)